MPKITKAPKMPKTKSKSDVSPARSVKFDIPGSDMSGKSPPRSGRKTAPGSGKPGLSPPRAKRQTSKDSAGSPAKGRKSSSSPPKQGPGSPRKASTSPARTGSGKSGKSNKSGKSGKSNKSKSSKAGSNKPAPELTESGLKIVDWSGQGLTTIPSNLVTAKDIGHLILASNNLRSLPLEIKKMKQLEKLDISKNGLRCNHGNDFSGLPHELAELSHLTELSVSECNLPFVPPAIFECKSLRNLDLSRNKINIMLPEIGNLESLVKLNLQQTNITSLPPELAYCQDLEEVYLWGNAIETLPETLPEMPKLKVLALNYRSFCGVVDAYMENLLRKGQIKSEHIPTVVFELPALEVLDLESTKLNTLPDVYNIQLKEFYLCHNFLQTIPQSIYKLKYLRVLDMSHNLLTNLPEDIGRLKSLRVLRLTSNNFERVPPTIGTLSHLEELDMSRNRVRRLPPEIKGLTSLKILNLERNCLQALPEEICDLVQLHTLDITDNEVKTLPMAIYRLTGLVEAHGFHRLEKYGLWLYKNPLEQPPPEVWRTENPDNIFNYLKKLQIIKTENLQRQKIQVLGCSQSGKTSLVTALSLRKSMLTNGLEDRTRILQQTMWKTENNVEFVLNDFGGDAAYRPLYPLFLDAKSLVLLVYNAEEFTEDNFYEQVGQWLDMLATAMPGAVIKIVGTQNDKLQPPVTEDDETKTLMSSCNGLHYLYPPSEKSRSQYHEDDGEEDESEEEEEDDDLFDMTGADVVRNTSTPAVPEPSHDIIMREMVVKHLGDREDAMRDELENVQGEVAQVKGEGKELNDLEETTLKMLQVREKKLEEILKTPLRVLPTVGVASSSETLEGVLQLVNELEHLAIDTTLFPHAQKRIPNHWIRMRAMLKQRKGYYLYWDDMVDTAKLFAIKGPELKECVQYLHDTADVLWYEDIPGLSEIIFHKPKMLVEILASLYRHDLTEFLTFENRIFLCRGRFKESQFEETRDIFLKTGEISRPLLHCLWFYQGFKNQDVAELLELLPLLEVCFAIPELDVPTGPLYNRPLMVIPYYNKDTDFGPLDEVWPAKPADGEKDLSAVYTFPFYYPTELIHMFSVQIHEWVDERLDWKDFIYAAADTERLIIQHGKDSQGHGQVTMVVRGADFTEVQDLMKELVEIFNSTLLRQPGLYWKLNIPMGGSSMKVLSDLGRPTRSSRFSRSQSKMTLV